MNRRVFCRVVMLIALAVLLAACGGEAAQVVPDAAATVAPVEATVVGAEPTAEGAESTVLATLEAQVSPEAQASPTPAPLPDDPTEAAIETLLRQMTLAEKIGQMTLVEKNSIVVEDITALGIGGVLSGGGGYPPRNSVAGWRKMVGEFQDAALASRLGIPIIYGVDAVHGHNNLEGATIFPQNIGLGATGNAQLVRDIGRATALEMAATGVRWDYAPVLAVVQDPRWGRTYESFGDDTALVTELGSAFILGLQDAGSALGLAGPTAALATPKHFIGDGATTWGTSERYPIDQGDMRVDEATIRARFLPPYAAAVESGAMSVMASFNSWNGRKVHGEKELLTGILKDGLGFGGFIVSDWQAIDQVNPDFEAAVIQSINAGVDMNMVPYDYRTFIDVLTTAVENGDVPISRIDDAVRRILRAKMALGLFEHPLGEAPAEAVGSAEHRALARQAVAQSLVLLQNEGDLLPLDKSTPLIFLAGEGANDIGLQSGGWTIEWQGAVGDITTGTTIREGLQAAVGPGTEIVFNPLGNFGRAVDAAGQPRTADVGVVVLAEKPYAEGEGDRADLRLSETEVDLIERVAERSERVVVVLLSGRPLVITEQLPLADAWVAAWLPGSEGAGVADVVFGDAPFTGRLSLDWPAANEDVPLATTGAKPLFPRGYGLTTP